MTEPPPDSDHNLPHVQTVSELSHDLKRTVEDKFAIVRVRGEISQPKVVGSGHCYLRLKDADAVLDGVVWRGAMRRLALQPEDGMEVVCTGRLSTYPGRSTYQIIIEQMELAGAGALLRMIEERRRRLAAEGLFDEAVKRPLPFLPEVIGVVTSPTGAVIRDILHRLNDRFPRRVIIWPVAVQGDAAAAQVAAAIAGFNALAPEGLVPEGLVPEGVAAGGSVPRPDLVIVARGGGSLEDLMAFNDEAVVRAVAAGTIPLIAAVGHETDTTLIDFAADRRAPTPTAAAEMAVPVRTELLAQVAGGGARLVAGMARSLREQERELVGLGRGLPDPHSLLQTATQRLDDWGERLAPVAGRWLDRRTSQLSELGYRLPTPQQHLEREAARLGAAVQALGALRGQTGAGLDRGVIALDGLAERLGRGWRQAAEASGNRLTRLDGLLESFSYERVLERGFALVKDDMGKPLTSVTKARKGRGVALRFHDGEVGAVITPGPRSREHVADRGKPKPPPAKPGDKQGSLL